MKKFIFQAASIGALCLVCTQIAIAQSEPVPPVPPDRVTPLTPPGEETPEAAQREIVIRQKSDSDVKVTIEIKNGDYFINGKPLEKYDDGNLIIIKKDVNDLVIASPDMNWGGSHFRVQSLDAERMQRDMERMGLDKQRMAEDRVRKSMRIRMNAAFLGVSSRKAEKGGATVLEVTKGSPADKAGIKKGDIIVKLNDTKIESPDALYEAVHNYKPGDKVRVSFTRDGKPQTVTATLEKAEVSPENFSYDYHFKMPEMPDMEMYGPYGPWYSREPKLGIKAQDAEDGKGVTVLQVEDSSAAFKAGLKKGDLILQFNGSDVNSTGELVDQFQEARKKSAVKVKIQRGTATQELEIKIPHKLKTAEL